MVSATECLKKSFVLGVDIILGIRHIRHIKTNRAKQGGIHLRDRTNETEARLGGSPSSEKTA